MKKEIETIKDKEGNIIAIIIYNTCKKEGTIFFTPPNFSQQLALISRKKDEQIEAHAHNLIKRNVYFTQETLFIREGKIKLNFYSRNQKYLTFRILKRGDVVLLASGGHGFEFLEDTEMIEVKQGPYSGSKDKVIFKNKQTK